MLETPPQRTLALVVGIDHYEYGDDWELAGPAADALRCVDWLLDRGVPQDHIALFLSARSWKDDPFVTQWVAKRQWPTPRVARRGQIIDFIDVELSESTLDAQALFVFWGGHGVVDDFEKSNYLYTEDAKDGRPYCISVPDLMGALHSRRFEAFGEQVLVVDACANAFSDTGEAAKPAWVPFARDATNNDIRQFQMFAASPGKLAANVSERRTGRFTEALFGALKRDTTAGWPDFESAFDQTLGDVEGAKLAEQQPYLVIDWPGRSRQKSGRLPGSSAAVRTLLALVKKTKAAPALLYRLYLRSLPDASRSIGPASIEKWLRDLEDKRPRDDNLPSPLVEFGERLARRLQDQPLADWVNDRSRDDVNALAALRSALDAETGGDKPRATLFIEIDAQTGAELRWWIHAPDPSNCSAQHTVPIDVTLKDDLASAFTVITSNAEHIVGHKYDLMVSIIVSEKLLLAELESLKVTYEEEGLRSKPVALNRRYPVTLHWHRRAHAGAEATGRPLKAWRQSLEALKPRFDAGGGADVVWLEPPQDEDDDPPASAAARLRDKNGTGICVGLGHAAKGQGDMPPEEIQGCLMEGVPCFFWLARPPASEAEVRTALCELFLRLEAREAPLAIGKWLQQRKSSDPLASLRIVWDEPSHLPSAQAFESPPHSSTGDAT